MRFCAGKRAVLLVEEGQPNFIEQDIASVLRQHDLQTASCIGKDMLPDGRRIHAPRCCTRACAPSSARSCRAALPRGAAPR